VDVMAEVVFWTGKWGVRLLGLRGEDGGGFGSGTRGRDGDGGNERWNWR